MRWLVVSVTLALLAVLNPVNDAQVWAATINAASCSSADVQSAVNSASNGDTVIVPAGTCTWTTQVAFTKSITLQGQTSGCPNSCTDRTIIVDGMTKNNNSPTAGAPLSITAVSGSLLRLTGFTFKGGSGGLGYQGAIQFFGSTTTLRVDHNHFQSINDLNVRIDGWHYGVLDHNFFDQGVCVSQNGFCSNINNGVSVRHPTWGNGAYGDQSWADPTNFGSGNAIFFEDNVVTNGATNDCLMGGRMVIRYNTMTNVLVQNHNGASRYRYCRSMEVYNNTFMWSPISSGYAYAGAMQFRAGTGVVWGNTTTGYVSMVFVFNDRSTQVEGFFGGAWPVNGGPNPWDQNLDSSGYATIDQIGRGQGDLLVGDTPTSAWPHQALEPWYEWNNTYTMPRGYGNATKWSVNPGATAVIQLNRDYYLNTPKPGYTPYTYPHPLVNGVAPLPPTNLTVQ